MFHRLILCAVASVVSIAAANATANAAAIILWPIDPTIQDGQRATALWIENKGKDPVTLQVRSLGWSQAGGEDRYADQDDVVASPPIAVVPGGQRQLVRIIRRAPGAAGQERSYRLLIDELPAPIEPSAGTAHKASLAVQMRYSIPLFTYTGNAADAPPSLRAHVELVGGSRHLSISNSGSHHARLVDLRSVAGGRDNVVTAGLVGYVLPGQTMRWPLPLDAGSGDTFKVNVNGTDQSLAPTL